MEHFTTKYYRLASDGNTLEEAKELSIRVSCVYCSKLLDAYIDGEYDTLNVIVKPCDCWRERNDL